MQNNIVIGALIGLGILYLVFRFGPAVIKKMKGGGAELTTQSGVVVFKDDVEAVLMFSSLRKLHHYVDGLPDPDAKTRGHAALAELVSLVGMPPEAPTGTGAPTGPKL